MTPADLRKLTPRQRLLRCAKDAAACRHLRRYGFQPDLGYLEKASDERLKRIVGSFFGTNSADDVLLQHPAYEGLP